jgi:hypothetical protein
MHRSGTGASHAVGPCGDTAIHARVSTKDQGNGCPMPMLINACQKRAERDRSTVSDAHVLGDEGLSGPTREPPRGERARPL